MNHIETCTDGQKMNPGPVPYFPCDECGNIYLRIKELMNHKNLSHIPQSKASNESVNEDVNKKLNEIQQNLALYQNQLNMVQLDHTGVLLNLVEKITEQQSVVKSFMDENKKLNDKITRIESNLSMTSEQQQQQQPKQQQQKLKQQPLHPYQKKQNHQNVKQKSKMLICGSSLNNKRECTISSGG